MATCNFSGLGRGISIGAVPVPHHMRDRQISKGEPQHAEDDHRGEFETLRKAAADQCDSDRGKGQLEHAEYEVRYVLAFAECGCHSGGWIVTGHEQLVERTDKRCQCAAFMACGERHAVAVDHPEYRNDAENHEALHDGRQRVFPAHHA